MGRKAKFSKALVEEICKHIADGLNSKDAVLLSGIREETYYRWLNRDDKDNNLTDEEYSLLSESVKKAEAERKKFFVGRIKAASYEQWQAAAWYLERRHPEEFAKKEVTSPVSDTPITAPQNQEQADLMFSLLSRLEQYRKQPQKEQSATDISLT